MEKVSEARFIQMNRPLLKLSLELVLINSYFNKFDLIAVIYLLRLGKISLDGVLGFWGFGVLG